MHINYEFKAVARNISFLEELLLKYEPMLVGNDHQIDTYFNVPSGRLKLREGTIEHALIYYERINDASAKQSNVILYQHTPDDALKELLTKSLGIKVVVDKQRKIYFINNVKFHFDKVKELGDYIEVEAIDKNGDIGLDNLKLQCQEFERLFEIEPADYIAESYSDMLLAKKYSKAR